MHCSQSIVSSDKIDKDVLTKFMIEDVGPET